MTWFTKFIRPARPARSFRTFLRLESLDIRATPSSLDTTGDTTYTGGTTNPTDPTQQAPASGQTSQPAPVQTAPDIDQFGDQQAGVGWELVYGHVTAANPAGLTVTLGGVPSLDGKTCVTDSNGNFSILVSVNTDGSDTGTIWAQTVDANGVQSNEALAYMNPTP
jgi:hypothetical protein